MKSTAYSISGAKPRTHKRKGEARGFSFSDDYAGRRLLVLPIPLGLVADDAVVLGRVVLWPHELTPRAVAGEAVLGVREVDMHRIVRDAGRALATDGGEQADHHQHEGDEDHGLYHRGELLLVLVVLIGFHYPDILAYGYGISIHGHVHFWRRFYLV